MSMTLSKTHKGTSLSDQRESDVECDFFSLEISIEILAMYWSQLYPGSFESARVAYREVSVHALNFAMVLTELCLNRMQLHRRLVVAPVLFITLYMMWTWFVDWIFGFWVYEFMRFAPRVL